MIAPPDTVPLAAPVASRRIDGRVANAFLLTGAETQAWDDFLRSIPEGQFQQSSRWADYKQSENWQSVNLVLKRDDAIVGGFQMLWRSSRAGRIGVISKGPVLIGKDPALESFLLDVLLDVARSRGVAAVLAQPPDHGSEIAGAMETKGFAVNRIMQPIDATFCIDVSAPPAEWQAKMRGTRRKEFNQAVRAGVTLYEGGDKDIPLFFELMSMTCQRQGVQPHPSTVEAVTKLIHAFRDGGESRLTFALYQGELAAAVLDLKFGRRLTAWKKGWNGRHRNLNTFLTHHSMQTAHALGCTTFDFAGIHRPLAEALLSGKPLTDDLHQHCDSVKLGFGGEARLLPPNLIYWVNPVLRFAYRHVALRPLLAEQIKSLVVKLRLSSFG